MALRPIMDAGARRSFIERVTLEFNNSYADRWPALTPHRTANYAAGPFPGRNQVYHSVDIRRDGGADVSIFFAKAITDEQTLASLKEAATKLFQGDQVSRRTLGHGDSVKVIVADPAQFDQSEDLVERAAAKLSQLLELAFAVLPAEAESEATGSNPEWSRDELILALDLYVRRGGAFPPKNDPEVQALSQTLSGLQRALGASGNTLRNSNGIGMKLMNFRAHDPAFAERAALTRGNRLEKEMWDEFASDPPRLAAVAAAIRATLEAEPNGDPLAAHSGELEGVEEAVEGRAMTVRHIRRERCHELVRAKKERARRKLGRLACEACGFDYFERYGERGSGFIECHHTRPISEMAEGDVTQLEDLALTCANCHRMIHAKRPWLTIPQMQALLKGGRRDGS